MDAFAASELIATTPPEFTPGAESTGAAASDGASGGAPSSDLARRDPLGDRRDLRAPRWEYPSFTMLELREMVLRGEGGTEKFERALAQAARMRSALELSLGELFAEFTEGHRLGRLGFSNLGDFTENLLGVRRRSAQVAAQLARALRDRLLLKAAAYEGVVSPSAALEVLPVAIGEDEERWVERAKELPVRKLRQLVREALKERKSLPGPDAAAEKAEADEEPWVLLRVPISDEDRADLCTGLALAGELVESSHRHVQLEALAQEYLSENPGAEWVAREAERTVERRLDPLDIQTKRDAAEAKLERETSSWEYLDPVHAVQALELDPYAHATDDELMAHAPRGGVRRFSSLRHRAVGRPCPDHRDPSGAREAPLGEAGAPGRERDGAHLLEAPLLKEVPQVDLLQMAQKAEKLTVIELKEVVQGKLDAQMSALKIFEARVPRSVAVLLEQAFEVSLMKRVPPEPDTALEDLRLDGAFLAELARHFIQAWCNERTKPKTVSQKQRARYPRCCFPGCSRRSCQGHHIEFRSRGRPEDAWNRMPLCAYHHLFVVHEGFATITGIFPEAVEFRVNGVVWKDAEFGRRRSERV
ncbi:MAG: HNH endonuclease signature motif containing protein [Anaeromyxobacteraceae bacterium]